MQRHPQIAWIYVAHVPGGYHVHCAVCRVTEALAPNAAQHFIAMHAEHVASRTHYGAGDAVAAVTKRLGIRSCTPCERRRQMLNQIAPRLWRR